MEIRLKKKYQHTSGVVSYPAKPRTNNTHHPLKNRKKSGKINHTPRVMIVDGRTGHSRMVAP